jgi:hypothetical protein
VSDSKRRGARRRVPVDGLTIRLEIVAVEPFLLLGVLLFDDY